MHCPNCNSTNTRRTRDGGWRCFHCSEEFIMPKDLNQLVGLRVDYVLDGRKWGLGIVEQYKRGKVTSVQPEQITIAWCIKCPETVKRVTYLFPAQFIEQVKEGRLVLREKAHTRGR